MLLIPLFHTDNDDEVNELLLNQFSILIYWVLIKIIFKHKNLDITSSLNDFVYS